jgi:hypothetical protein
MSKLILKIKKLLKEVKGDIKAIKEKKAKLLKENAIKIKAAISKKDGLVDLKEYLLA